MFIRFLEGYSEDRIELLGDRPDEKVGTAKHPEQEKIPQDSVESALGGRCHVFSSAEGSQVVENSQGTEIK